MTIHSIVNKRDGRLHRKRSKYLERVSLKEKQSNNVQHTMGHEQNKQWFYNIKLKGQFSLQHEQQEISIVNKWNFAIINFKYFLAQHTCCTNTVTNLINCSPICDGFQMGDFNLSPPKLFSLQSRQKHLLLKKKGSNETNGPPRLSICHQRTVHKRKKS